MTDTAGNHLLSPLGRPTAALSRGLALTLLLPLLAGCGRSADEVAAQDKERSERALAAAQAELEADQEKLRRIARGELRALPAPAPPQESNRGDAPDRPPADAKAPSAPIEASTAPAAAARSAESVFSEVASSVARVQVMDATNRMVVIGSGVVIDNAVVLTNCHVVMRGAKLTVKIGNAVMPATIQLADEALDLCRLTVPGLRAPAVTIGTVASLRTGQRVYAVGAPEGLELTISDGIVSALRKVDEGTVIQTTAPISPGSSGGGLFDASGRLVGVMTFQHRYGQNLNFALPADWIGQMRARRASEAVWRPPFSAEPSQDAARANLIVGQWLCRDWVSGRTGQYNFGPEGSVSIAMYDGKAVTLRYRVSGNALQLSDAKQGVTITIQELAAGRMILRGADRSLACER
jgi:S1-C subfamily serine protease